MNYKEYADKHRLILRKDYVDGLHYELVVDDDGVLTAHYYPDGYEYVSCYFNSGSIGGGLPYASIFRLAYMTALNLSYLNEDKSTDVLLGYMDLLCKERLDLKEFTVRRDKMRDAIELVKSSGIFTIQRRSGSYIWKKRLSLSEKRRIIGSRIKEKTTMKNVESIETAINSLKENTELFITYSTIVDELVEMGITSSVATVKRYMNEAMHDEISAHNLSLYNTDSFKIYEKTCNVYNIVGAIEALALMNKRITKASVLNTIDEKVRPHRNTINNLWLEDEVQATLNKYNQIK